MKRTVMVNNSTNINKINNNFSLQLTEHTTKYTTTYDVGNPGICFGQAENMAALKR